ncbi:MAG: SAM-dependent methyltransferase [Burkholderiaceae bacterium]|nr:SAM-dependent methyltransferase [Burkholderiaceae bacterium]
MPTTTAPHPLPESSASALSLDRFIACCAANLVEGRSASLLLSKHCGPAPDLQRVTVRPIVLRGELHLSFVYRHDTRDMTKNLPVDAALRTVRDLLGPVFRDAHLHTADEAIQLTISQRGVCTLRSRSITGKAASDRDEFSQMAHGHDREKQRWVDVTRPFLTELGVTTAAHTVVPAMSRKWKQINKFVEVFAGALRASRLLEADPAAPGANRPVRVTDFGAGKGYLTFAVHDHLRQLPGIAPEVTGVELRPDMVRLGNAAVNKLGLVGLRFEEGDVRSQAARPIDVMIALHACDTATDHAIDLGLRGGAAVIVCSPCCHKELRPQLLSPHPLKPILQHGVHLGQQAEMLTDGLRAMLLEASGYDTQVFEFVALEHTQKNKMILAVKRTRPQPAEAVWAQIDDIKAFYGIREQCLENLLRDRLNAVDTQSGHATAAAARDL